MLRNKAALYHGSVTQQGVIQQGVLADALRESIIDGEFAPGSKLSESMLAERFEVSRNTVREAFRVLAEQRLIEHVPHRGVSVAAPTIADVIDIYRVRRTIECTTLRECEPQHPAVERMKDALDEAERVLPDKDWHGVGSANMAFHVALIDLADSPRLARTYRNLAAELRLVFLAIDDPRSLHEPFVRKNRVVLEALVNEGPDAAADALEEYLVHSERLVLGAFARMGKS